MIKPNLKLNKKVSKFYSTSEINTNNIIGNPSISTTYIQKSLNTSRKTTLTILTKNKFKNLTSKILKSLSENKSLKYKNKKSGINKLKFNYQNRNSTLKTSREMSIKFYIRNREAIKGIGKSNDLYSGFIKDPKKIINKILLDYKNIKKYDREDLIFDKTNYERNIEYIENKEKIQKGKKIKEIILFDKLKEVRKNIYNKKPYFKENQSKSYSLLNTSSINHKSKLKEEKKPSLKNIFEYEDKLEKKVNNCIKNNKKLMLKKIKNNSIRFCNSIDHINFICKPYEPINEETSKINLKRNNFFNIQNLERISKIKTIIRNGFDIDDFECNGKYIKEFSKEYDLIADKALSGYLPKFAKKANFHNKTLLKYNNLNGKYFGFPC